MPIVSEPGVPRHHAFERCPLDDRRRAITTTRDVGPDPSDPGRPDPGFRAALGLGEEAFAWCGQVHGRRILALATGGPQGRGDALVTDRASVVLVIRTADCLPVFLVDRHRRALGLVHAGWRGAAAGIIGDAVRALQTLYGVHPEDLWAGVGPAIGPDRYEVGREVRDAFAPEHARPHRDRWLLDLPGVARSALVEAGVGPDAVELSGECTASQPDDYVSYRSEKTDSRLFSLLGPLPRTSS